MPDDADKDDKDEATQAVAAAFHHMRSKRKQAARDQPKGVPHHHRANTDWWNCIDKK